MGDIVHTFFVSFSQLSHITLINIYYKLSSNIIEILKSIEYPPFFLKQYEIRNYFENNNGSRTGNHSKEIAGVRISYLF